MEERSVTRVACTPLGSTETHRLWDEDGAEVRRGLIRHLVARGEGLKRIPLEIRLKYIQEAVDGALREFEPDPNLPYHTTQQVALMESLMKAVSTDNLKSALALSAEYANADISLFDGKELALPPVGLFVQSRNADALTEWVLYLAAGMPVLVKGTAMSLHLARQLEETDLGDYVAVVDWTSGSPCDEFYSMLPDGALMTIFGSIIGGRAIIDRLSNKDRLVIRQRLHRSSIGYVAADGDIGHMMKALVEVDGAACFSPVSIFTEGDPLSLLEEAFDALEELSTSRPMRVPRSIMNERMAFGDQNFIPEGDYIARSSVGALYALPRSIRVCPPGFRSAAIFRAWATEEGWMKGFSSINEQLAELALQGIGGGGCGQYAVEIKGDLSDRQSILDYFSPDVPYRWMQALCYEGTLSCEMLGAFVRAGGTRIVDVPHIAPRNVIPPDGEPPIPLLAQNGLHVSDPAPTRLTYWNDETVIAEDGKLCLGSAKLPGCISAA